MDSVFLTCFLRKPGRFPPDGGDTPPDPGGGGGGDDDTGGGGGFKKVPDVPPFGPPEKPGPGPPSPGPIIPTPFICSGWLCNSETKVCDPLDFKAPDSWEECWPGGITNIKIGDQNIFKEQQSCNIACKEGPTTPGPDDPPEPPRKPGPTTPRGFGCKGWKCNSDLKICEPLNFAAPDDWNECWPEGVTQINILGTLIFRDKKDCSIACKEGPITGGPTDPPKPPTDGPTTPPNLQCDGWICNPESNSCDPTTFFAPAAWKECWPGGLSQVTIGGTIIFKNFSDCTLSCEDDDKGPGGPSEPPKIPGPSTPRELGCKGWVCDPASQSCSPLNFVAPDTWEECWPGGISQISIGGLTIFRDQATCVKICQGEDPPDPPDDPPRPPIGDGPTTPPNLQCDGWVCNTESNTCDPVTFFAPAAWKECWPGGSTSVTIGGTTIFLNFSDCTLSCEEDDDDKGAGFPEQPPEDPPGPITPPNKECNGWVCNKAFGFCSPLTFVPPAKWKMCWPDGISQVSIGGNTIYKDLGNCAANCMEDEGERDSGSPGDNPEPPPEPDPPENPPDGGSDNGDSSNTLENHFVRTYRKDFVDPVFDRRLNFLNLTQPNNNVRVNRGDLKSTLFKKRVHSSIRSITEINKGSQKFSDLPYGDISEKNIQLSLQKEFSGQILSLRDLAGRSLSNRVLTTIKNLIVSNDLSRFNPSIFRKLRHIQKSRDIKFTVKTGSRTSVDEVSAVTLALDKSKSLDFSLNYGRVQQENLKLWKITATDIGKYIPITFAAGTTGKLFVGSDDGINTKSLRGIPSKLLIDDGDLWKTEQGDIPVKSDIDRAVMLDFEETEQVMYLLDDTYSIQLNVDTVPGDLVEESYDLSTTRNDFYFFKLDATTITDLPRTNELIRKTRATYSIITNDINVWAKNKPWPYFVFYVMHDDPILDYLEASETATLTFKDFSLDTFLGDALPIFPRRLPWHFIIVPTDKTELVLYHTYSKVTDFGSRQLTFTLNINSDEYKQRWDHHYLKPNFSHPRLDSRKKLNTQAVLFTIDSQKVTDIERYITGSEVLPRREKPYRKVLKLLRKFRDEFILNDITVAWFDVYRKMDPSDIKSLPNELLNFREFKSKALLRQLSTVDRVSRQYPKVKDIPTLGETNSTTSFGHASPVRKDRVIESTDTVEPL